MRRGLAGIIGVLLVATSAAAREPIIDIHMHAAGANDQGPPPLALCAPIYRMPVWDQRAPWGDALIA